MSPKLPSSWRVRAEALGVAGGTGHCGRATEEPGVTHLAVKLLLQHDTVGGGENVIDEKVRVAHGVKRQVVPVRGDGMLRAAGQGWWERQG